MRENSFHTLKDEDIIRKIREEENPHWYALLYTRYQRKVSDKCYSMLKERKLAEEVAKDVLSRAFEKLASFKGNSSFSSWLYSITYNHCIDYLRTKKKLHYPKWIEQNEIPEIIDEDDDNLPEISLTMLEKALENIHPEEKALLMMRYEYNLNYKQISAALRITESAAKMRMKRAKARMLYLMKKMEKTL
jgi:RNA polymerase sigma factor (sigma-70 family)